MRTKIIILAVMLSLIPAVSNAKTSHTIHALKIARIARTIHYPYTLHRLVRVRCPYAGCRSQIQP